MASFQRTCFFTGGALAALALAFPAQAEDASTAAATMADAAPAVMTQLNFDVTQAAIEVGEFDVSGILTDDDESLLVEDNILTDAVPTTVASTIEEDYSATSEALVLDDSATASTEASTFNPVDVAQTTNPLSAGEDVAQVTRPLYRGVSPFYVGIGGNIGFIDSGKSAVGDFGFNVISKVSLGPRFAVRPSLQFSEDDFNITLPVTYNFNPLEFGRFSMYPSIGGGVDFGDDIGFLVNGGVDIPISRDFTLNSQVNWRVSEDTGLGLSLGIGYNFPLFFE